MTARHTVAAHVSVRERGVDEHSDGVAAPRQSRGFEKKGARCAGTVAPTAAKGGS
jgi:hypothetical protein